MPKYRLTYEKSGRESATFSYDERLFPSYRTMEGYSTQKQIYLVNEKNEVVRLQKLVFDKGNRLPWGFWVPRDSFVGFNEITETQEGDEIR